MKEINGKKGRVIFGDCFQILPKLKKKFDVCLTDPPYNVKATTVTRSHNKNYREVKEYNDDIKNYKEYSTQWFKPITEICNKAFFTIGRSNIPMWFEIDPSLDILVWIIPNSPTRWFTSKFMGWEPIMIYGKFKPKEKLNKDYIIQHTNSGFLGKGGMKIEHPHPKPIDLYVKLLKDVKPKSVIDPFMGSGTTAQACEILGIDYLGIEKEIQYKGDIERRIKEGIKLGKIVQKKSKKLLEIR